MSWGGQIDGPIPLPIFGEADAEGERELLGFEPGYRLNIAPALMSAELEPYRVTPTTPQRIWAGDEPPFPETVFLLFADEDEARASALGAWWIDETEGDE